MDISVIGAGYVGLVAAACFSNEGHRITCVDMDKTRVSQLSLGILTFHEPDLGELVLRQLDAGRLSFTEDLDSAVGGDDLDGNLTRVCLGRGGMPSVSWRSATPSCHTV